MRFVMILAALSVALEATVDAAPANRSRRIPRVSTTYRPAPMSVRSSTEAAPSPARVQVIPASSSKTEVTVDEKQAADENVAASEVNAEDEALQEVNAARARRGLRPFQPDPLLAEAARRCAEVRASRRIAGHLSSDFAYLPSGASARAAGCGALEPSWGWGTCCTYDNYTYAGAAWVMGTDGRRYMHLFVR